MIRALRGVLAALVVAGGAACSSATQGSADPATQIRLTVENDFIPPTTLSVYAIPENGSRRLVGLVRPGDTAALSWSGAITSDYRFSAQTTTGEEIVSNSINLGPGQSAVWNVRSNVVVGQ